MGKKRPIAQPTTAADSPREVFARRHAGQPFLKAPVLYALTEPIVDAVQAEVPRFFTPEQERFERDLARTASFGFFHGHPLGFETTEEEGRPRPADGLEQSIQAINDMLQDEYLRCGASESQIHRYSQKKVDRRQEINARKVAYVGWLVTNREFHGEVAELRAIWETLVRQLGRFPAFPRWPSHDVNLDEEVPDDFCRDFLVFYSRWGLDRLLTWDWPVPMEPDLVGGMLQESNVLAEMGVSLFVPWYLLRGEKLNLQEIARRHTEVSAPDHLRGWIEKQGTKPDKLGALRYERLALLYRFLGLALRRRYPQACRRKAQKLDQALSQVLGRDEESVRKLRQELQRSVPGF